MGRRFTSIISTLLSAIIIFISIGVNTEVFATGVIGHEIAQYAIETAEKSIPYVHGGTSPSTGMDCSGFTKYVYSQFNISLPAGNKAQINVGEAVDITRYKADGNVSDLMEGDLIFFDWESDGVSNHVGIYVGNGRMAHASSGSKKTVVADITAKWAYPYVCAVRRIIQSCQHEYTNKIETAHPHKEYKECTRCGDKIYTGKIKVQNNCDKCISENTVSGRINDNITWEYNKVTKELYINGKGAIKNYFTPVKETSHQKMLNNINKASSASTPWRKYRNDIKKIYIGKGITSIGRGSFAGCEAVKTVILPTTLKKIGSYAFAGDYYLSNVSIPSSVTTIESGAFAWCSLKKLVLKEGIETIGTAAFYMGNPAKLTIPRSVKKLDTNYMYCIGSWEGNGGALYYFPLLRVYSGSYGEKVAAKPSVKTTFYAKNKVNISIPYFQVDKKKLVINKPELVSPSYSSMNEGTFAVSGNAMHGVELYRGNSRLGKFVKVAAENFNSLTITPVIKDGKKPLKGKIYYYKARSYVNFEGKKYYSGYSTIVKVKIK